MSIETLVDVELEDRLEQLSKMKGGSDEYKVTVDGITKLLDRRLEMEKLTQDAENKVKDRLEEQSFRAVQAAEERKDRIIKHCLTALSIGSSVGLTVWGTYKSLKFEETGTITTSAGRNFIRNLFSKK